jgi:hypothetical protein
MSYNSSSIHQQLLLVEALLGDLLLSAPHYGHLEAALGANYPSVASVAS